MGERVKIVEVGARDGLQNEPKTLAATLKIELIERLADAGMAEIEAGSFVSPQWVPQMADTESVLAGIKRKSGVRYPVLVPNLPGLARARAAGVEDISVFTAASDAFNRKNINASIDESLARIKPVVEQALTERFRVRGYVSTVLGCPYQGEVAVSEVVRVTRALVDMGCVEISLGDTIGVGTPSMAREMFRACVSAVGAEKLAVHFHDTRGQALANIYACLEIGARTVDASVAGLGGCPYANGASGNMASEDLVFMLHGLGLETGVNLAALTDTARWISHQLGREPASKMARIKSKA